jgi:DNA replication and repair protein RecF
MSLLDLSVTNVRCLEAAQLQIPRGLTLIWGANGSGKTSLLEAIFLLGRGRSFRTRNTERLIRRGQDHLRVIGHLDPLPGHTEPRPIGFEVSPAGSAARVGGRGAESLAELSQAFAVQVIEPGIHKLVEEGGHRRRRWMDWSVFHVEPQFVETWVRYTRALRQRNAALRVQPATAAAFDGELARLGEQIAESRRKFLEQLQPYWRETVSALSGLDVQLHYVRGWSAEVPLLESLAASRARDEARHLTHSGPHRADVTIRTEGRPAREVLSRGQQKLVAVAMTVAQLRLLKDLTGTAPTLLLDDPAAELDGDHLQCFIEQVLRLESQLVVTSLTSESRLFGSPQATFYVAQGRVQHV